MVAATPPNKPVKLTIWRDGKEYEVELKTAALNPNRPAPPPPEPEKPKPPATVDAFGLKLAKITPELRKQFSLPDGAKGVVITEVPPNSAGAAQGLRPGDLVVAIGQAPLAGPEQVPQLAAAREEGQPETGAGAHRTARGQHPVCRAADRSRLSRGAPSSAGIAGLRLSRWG